MSNRRGRPEGAWKIGFTVVAVAASLLFVRLGIWQMDRLGEKRAASAVRQQREARPPLELADVTARLRASPAADTELAWRRVRLAGRWDYDHEVLIRGRSFEGTPGVYVVTPLVPDAAGADSSGAPAAELPVLRGWLPSPDAMTPVTISTSESGLGAAEGRTGVLLRSAPGAGEPVIAAGEGGDRRPTLAALDMDAIADLAADSVSILPMFAHLEPAENDSTAIRRGEPLAFPIPDPGNGPHLSYAIQWFSFALITLVGTWAFVYRRPRPVRRPTDPGVSGDRTPD